MNAFQRFYAAPSPILALKLAIADAVAQKQSQEFYENLVRARDQLEAFDLMLDALKLQQQTERPFAPAPEGLGLAYNSDNLASDAWAARKARVEELIAEAVKKAEAA